MQNDYLSDKIIEMHLADEPFRQISSGEKTVEVRLFDEKRKSIHVGDKILFSRCDGSEEAIRAQVVALHRAQSFREFFTNDEMLEKAGFNGMTVDEATVMMNRYYIIEQEQTYGVLGIEFVKE